MAAEGERSSDFYAVLGLKKGCTSSELRKAYKKLALGESRGGIRIVVRPLGIQSSRTMRRRSSRRSKRLILFFRMPTKDSCTMWEPTTLIITMMTKVPESFDLINTAIASGGASVFLLSCLSVNFKGMGDFLNEMAAMMTQTQTTESGGDESFEALQELFEEIFHRDMEGFGSSSASSSRETNSCSNKRNSSQMNSAMAFNDHCQTFSLGATGGMSAGRYQHRKRRTGASRRKH